MPTRLPLFDRIPNRGRLSATSLRRCNQPYHCPSRQRTREFRQLRFSLSSSNDQNIVGCWPHNPSIPHLVHRVVVFRWARGDPTEPGSHPLSHDKGSPPGPSTLAPSSNSPPIFHVHLVGTPFSLTGTAALLNQSFLFIWMEMSATSRSGSVHLRGKMDEGVNVRRGVGSYTILPSSNLCTRSTEETFVRESTA